MEAVWKTFIVLLRSQTNESLSFHCSCLLIKEVDRLFDQAQICVPICLSIVVIGFRETNHLITKAAIQLNLLSFNCHSLIVWTITVSPVIMAFTINILPTLIVVVPRLNIIGANPINILCTSRNTSDVRIRIKQNHFWQYWNLCFAYVKSIFIRHELNLAISDSPWSHHRSLCLSDGDSESQSADHQPRVTNHLSHLSLNYRTW